MQTHLLHGRTRKLTQIHLLLQLRCDSLREEKCSVDRMIDRRASLKKRSLRRHSRPRKRCKVSSPSSTTRKRANRSSNRVGTDDLLTNNATPSKQLDDDYIQQQRHPTRLERNSNPAHRDAADTHYALRKKCVVNHSQRSNFFKMKQPLST